MSVVRLGTLDSIWAGEMMAVSARGTKVLLVNLDGTLHAYRDRCAHRGVELSKGKLEGRVITCWAHEWQYDAATGEGINPRGVRLQRLPVKVEGNYIFVDVGD
jgi:toluene monooxygenase system ferredoxin subunit